VKFFKTEHNTRNTAQVVKQNTDLGLGPKKSINKNRRMSNTTEAEEGQRFFIRIFFTFFKFFVQWSHLLFLHSEHFRSPAPCHVLLPFLLSSSHQILWTFSSCCCSPGATTMSSNHVWQAWPVWYIYSTLTGISKMWFERKRHIKD